MYKVARSLAGQKSPCRVRKFAALSEMFAEFHLTLEIII